uniref:Uncharacterized protein n=1 Tax=Anguilla anguilla TaxID=7936 RepID=A0A0E9USU1_ANGAN
MFNPVFAIRVLECWKQFGYCYLTKCKND